MSPLSSYARRGVASLALVALAGVSLAACGSEDAPAAKPAAAGIAVDKAAAAKLPADFKDGIEFASDPHSPPMESYDEDNKLVGFDYDLIQAIGAKLGVKATMNDQAWDGLIPSIQSKKYDAIISGMNDTPEREQVLDYVDYFYGGFGILVAKGNPKKIGTALDLCGQTVAVQKSTVQGDILTEMSKKDCPAGKPITLQTYPAETDAQNALRAGKTVAEVVDSYIAVYAAQTAGNGQYFDLVDDPKNPAGIEPLYTGMGVLKGNDGLRDAIAAATQSLIDDGSYAKLLKKWNLGSFAVDKVGVDLATKG